MTVQFVITGFGEFAGVKTNPTQQLVEWLQTEHHHHHPKSLPHSAECTADACKQCMLQEKEEDFNIISCTVLEVSACAVGQFLEEQQALLAHACRSADKQPVVLLHLGVDTQRNGMNLELQAYNNATFRCPDQAGWQPAGAVIEQGPGLGLNSIRTTAVPVHQLAQELQEAGFDCHVSHDAGRFVCNFIYHKSLQLIANLQQQSGQQQQQVLEQEPAAGGSSSSGGSGSASWAADGSDRRQEGVPASSSETGLSTGSSSDGSSVPLQRSSTQIPDACEGTPVYALFLHVPSFAAMPEQEQKEFVLQLLRRISRWLNNSSAKV